MSVATCLGCHRLDGHGARGALQLHLALHLVVLGHRAGGARDTEVRDTKRREVLTPQTTSCRCGSSGCGHTTARHGETDPHQRDRCALRAGGRPVATRTARSNCESVMERVINTHLHLFGQAVYVSLVLCEDREPSGGGWTIAYKDGHVASSFDARRTKKKKKKAPMWHNHVLQLRKVRGENINLMRSDPRFYSGFSSERQRDCGRVSSRANCALHRCSDLNLSAKGGTPSRASEAHDWGNFYNSARILVD